MKLSDDEIARIQRRCTWEQDFPEEDVLMLLAERRELLAIAEAALADKPGYCASDCDCSLCVALDAYFADRPSDDKDE